MESKKGQNHKKSLCRYYLRGLCIKNSHQCPLAHGIWDLSYDYWKQGQIVNYQYNKNKDENHLNMIKGSRVYKNLYQFQQQKIFTLEQINENRQIRSQIRNLMHQQLFVDFMQLLQIKHPDTIFTQQFLLRQFSRAGLNKTLMMALKFSHITSYLCECPNSLFLKISKNIPPHPNKQNFIVRRASQQKIVQFYRNEYLKIVEQNKQKQLQEGLIKKKLFTVLLPDNIPALNVILKQQKVNLSQFIQIYLNLGPQKIILEASLDQIQEVAIKYLNQNLEKQIVTWNNIYNYITKTLKSNNGNIINQIKANLVLKNNMFLFFPMNQFIYHPKLSTTLFKQKKNMQPCKCNFQKSYKYQQLCLPQEQKYQLKNGQSYDINDFQSLIKCAPHILNSKILGVDLQGNLRKGGFVQMIQLNNGHNTFLIDIWMMNQKADFQTFWLARKIIRNVMVNSDIVKIFHDCRHDSIGLHEMIETCIINVFDTSATQTLINQLNVYEKIFKKQQKDLLGQCKGAISTCNNVKTPGLNEILKKYEASHGTNKNKDKYHKMWSKGDISLFCMRPLDPDYRQYCIKDVLDLPQIFHKMVKNIPQYAQDLAFWISQQYSKYGYASIQDEKE